MMRLPPDQLHRILDAGIRAPSAENKHDLRFQSVGESVRLLATDQASWAAQPHRQFLALMSFGAVVENIRLRSAELGHDVTVEWLPEANRPDIVADFRWAPTAAPPDPLCRAIELRHTNRRFYRRATLPAETLARLSAAVDAVPGAGLLWLDDAHRRGLALTAIRVAETERFRRRALHAELFGAVRFEIGWQRSSDEWLPPAALQIEAPMRLPFAALRHWPLMRALDGFGAHHALGLRAGYLPCALAPHIGLILAKAQREDLGNLKAGRALQRVWLAAAAEGLALQPMAAATALSVQNSGTGWVSAAVKLRLQQLLGSLCEGQEAQPYMLFRLGRADAPTAVTGRLPLAQYLG
jgi:nitroreductase